ncbi:MAG: hypothetical protein KF745_13055 [Phycisphaeraceae bacterium]|nr:hypothetical protein [Phycisphaeraceae bacterium]
MRQGSRRCPTRSQATLAAVSLLLGAIATLTTAWAPGIIDGLRATPRRQWWPDVESEFIDARGICVGSIDSGWWTAHSEFPPFALFDVGSNHVGFLAAMPRKLPMTHLPRWAATPPMRSVDGQVPPFYTIDATGLPWRCAKSAGLWIGDYTLEHQGAWVFRLHGTTHWTVPFSPIWPGLIGNLIVWSTLAALLLWSPAAAHRWYRRRAGCCPTCRYDLTGLSRGAPCPEYVQSHS